MGGVQQLHGTQASEAGLQGVYRGFTGGAGVVVIADDPHGVVELCAAFGCFGRAQHAASVLLEYRARGIDVIDGDQDRALVVDGGPGGGDGGGTNSLDGLARSRERRAEPHLPVARG